MAARLGLDLKPSRQGGFNFAFGGTRLDPRSGPHGLRAQADAFLAMPQPEGRILYVVYGGGNDLLAAIGAPRAPSMVDAATTSLRSILADLATRGARDLLVPNLPNVGITPAARARGSRAVAKAGALTDRFDAALDRILAELAADPKLRVRRLDVRSMAEQVEKDPGGSGFVDIVTPCGRQGRCEGCLFWDDVHPTTEAHGRLAEAAFDAVSDQHTR